MQLFAYEYQRNDGFVSKRIESDSSVTLECQVFNIALANRETLIGIFESPSGITRKILYRPA
jgi:hypothetical protein